MMPVWACVCSDSHLLCYSQPHRGTGGHLEHKEMRRLKEILQNHWHTLNSKTHKQIFTKLLNNYRMLGTKSRSLKAWLWLGGLEARPFATLMLIQHKGQGISILLGTKISQCPTLNSCWCRCDHDCIQGM